MRIRKAVDPDRRGDEEELRGESVKKLPSGHSEVKQDNSKGSAQLQMFTHKCKTGVKKAV